MVLVLPSFLEERRPSGAAPTPWRLFPLPKEAAGVPGLTEVIEALKEQGLIRPVVVRTFIHHRILPLRERMHTLWQH